MNQNLQMTAWQVWAFSIFLLLLLLYYELTTSTSRRQ
jgi:hypothetical protein